MYKTCNVEVTMCARGGKKQTLQVFLHFGHWMRHYENFAKTKFEKHTYKYDRDFVHKK